MPRYEDCGHKNPCNITKLEQHTQYLVRVKASNIGGESKFSREVPVVTKVDVAMIPAPGDVHYARTSRTATFRYVDTIRDVMIPALDPDPEPVLLLLSLDCCQNSSLPGLLHLARLLRQARCAMMLCYLGTIRFFCRLLPFGHFGSLIWMKTCPL